MNTGVRAIMGAAIWSAALAGAATPAAAQDGAAGRWVVSGKVGPFGFTLNCRFDEAGSALSGACVDGATSDARVKGGKRHELTQGKVVGDHVTFSYDSSFMFKHFNVDYTGVLRGDKMSGTILANGQSGAFTATRGGG
jgi:hypothetical protein